MSWWKQTQQDATPPKPSEDNSKKTIRVYAIDDPGNPGTVVLASIDSDGNVGDYQGPQGDQGDQGVQGPQGDPGTEIESVSVANINDPSAELAAKSGTAQGSLLAVYQDDADGANPGHIYQWDTSSKLTSAPPLFVPGAGGLWVAATTFFFSKQVDVTHTSSFRFHGKVLHVHGRNSDPNGGRWWGIHPNPAIHQLELVTRFRNKNTAMATDEIDFYHGPSLLTRTLSNAGAAVPLTIKNGDDDYAVSLVMESDTVEVPTWPATVKQIGTYDPSVINYGTLYCLSGNIRAVQTVQFTGNTFVAGDGIALNGKAFVEGTDWTLGSTLEQSLLNLAHAMEDSTDIAIKHLFFYSLVSAGGDTLTITARNSGTAENAITLTKIDTNANITLGGATLLGGVEPEYLLTWQQEGPKEAPTKEHWVNPYTFTAAYGEYAVRNASASASTFFTGRIPHDFNSLVSIEVIGIVGTGANTSNKDIDLFSNYALDGEEYQTNAESDTTTLYDLTGGVDEIQAIDVSAVFSSLQAGHNFGLEVDHVGISGSIRYLGLKLRYQ